MIGDNFTTISTLILGQNHKLVVAAHPNRNIASFGLSEAFSQKEGGGGLAS